MAYQSSRYQAFRRNVALTTALATTPEIEFVEFSDMAISIPTGSPINSLTFYGAAFTSSEFASFQAGPSAATPTFLPLTNAANGNAITLAVSAGNMYDNFRGLGLISVGAVKIVANAAGSVDISMKS